MNKLLTGITALAAFAISGSVFGQVAAELTVGNGSGGLGSATPVQISIDVSVPDDTAFGGQISVTYDDTQLTPDFTNCGADGWVCNDLPGEIRFVYFKIDGMFNPVAMVSTTLGTVDFDISTAAVDVYALAISAEEWTDAGGGILTTTGSNPGSIEVLGPTWSSDPVDGGSLTMSAIIGNNPTDTLDITNAGAGTLAGTCIINGTNQGKFSFTTDGDYSAAGSDSVVVQCDGSVDGNFSANLQCGTNDINLPETNFPLSCNITLGPQPAIGATPSVGAAFNFSTTFEDEAPPVEQILTIDNIGDNETTLNTNSDCTIGGTNPDAFTRAPGSFSVARDVNGNTTPAVITVRCTATTEGTYSAELSCPHNGSNGTPSMWPLNCDIGPQRPATFAATPAPGGAVIDITSGLDVVVGDEKPTTTVRISNTSPVGAKDLTMFCMLDGNGTPMTYAPTLNGTPIVAGGFVDLVISVNTDVAGDPLTDTLRCSYDDGSATDNPEGVPLPQVAWDFSAVVREAASELVASPPSGTPINGEAEIGGSTILSVSINEALAEDAAAEITSCQVAGDGYTLLTGGFPIDMTNPTNTVPVLIEVEFTDPGTGAENSPYAGGLGCTVVDTQNSAPVLWEWDLSVEVAGAASFRVTKVFDGGYDDEEALVSMTCNGGNNLYDEFTLGNGDFVLFSNDNFESGAINCDIREENLAEDFEPTYDATGSDSAFTVDEDGCHFTAVESGDENFCVITNGAAFVDVVINKVWETFGSDSTDVFQGYWLRLYCDAMIQGGYMFGYAPTADEAEQIIILPPVPYGTWYKDFSGVGDDDFTAKVMPMEPETKCWVDEYISGQYSDIIEVDNGCRNIEVELGKGDECTITNTVFFEGIPTLSQWGMAIMALLMLGVGMVGFRRYV